MAYQKSTLGRTPHGGRLPSVAAMTNQTVVSMRGVTRRYEADGPPALDQVNVEVIAGEAVAVMGPSGSGKSTMLNLIAGVDRADAGEVEVAGQNLGRLSETALAKFRRTRVGVIFQFFNLLEDLTVRDNVLLPAQLAGDSKQAGRARAMELLEQLGIADKANAYPARMSGGQRQRVAVARALVNRPALLLADEPTGAVDARTGQQVVQLLRELNQSGQTLIVVTHDPEVAKDCANRLITLRDGRVEAGALR
jgi:putative ABC transport system ATP-binding protein